jgi:hypothetical protein
MSRLLRLVSISCFVSVTAYASTIGLTSGSLTATGILPSSGGILLDVRGFATFTVSNSGTPIGAFVMTDSTVGTDPGFSTLPFGNAELLDFGATPGTFATTNLDLSHPVLVSNVLFLGGVTTAPSGLDPGLQTLFSDDPLVLAFALTSVVPFDGGIVAQWSLVGIGPQTVVPEPVTAILMLSGIGLMAEMKRRGRALV